MHTMKTQRAICVVGENNLQDVADVNAQSVSAISHLMEKLNNKHCEDMSQEPCGTYDEDDIIESTRAGKPISSAKPPLVASVGHQMMEQLQPWYVGISFAFVVLHWYASYGEM